MKTSKANRLEEFRYLSLLGSNGRLLTKKGIKRLLFLKKEFQQPASERVLRSKTVEKA